MKNIIKYFFLRLIIAIGLAFLLLAAIVIGSQTHPEILFLGFLSFVIVIVIIGLVAAISSIYSHVGFRKRYPDIYLRANSKKSPFSKHMEINTQINALDDMYFRKIKRSGNLVGIICILLWVGFLLTLIIGGLYLKIKIITEFLEQVNQYISAK